MSRLNFGFLRRKPLRKSRSRSNLAHQEDHADMLTADLQKLSAAVAAADS